MVQAPAGGLDWLSGPESAQTDAGVSGRVMLVEASEQVSATQPVPILGIPTRPGVVDSLLQFATVDLTLVDEDAAFGMLRERSGASNRKFVHLAAAVVDGRRLLAKQPGVR